VNRGPRVAILTLLAAAVCLVAVAQEPAVSTGWVIAVLPLQNRAGDGPATFAVEQALGAEFRARADVVDPGRARRALRQLRLRNGDAAAPDLLQELGRILGADFLITATLHDAERRGVPRITVSVRAYSGAGGELLWTGFAAGSGLDHRGVFELGLIDRIEALAPGIVRRMMDDLLGTGLTGGRAHTLARATYATEPGRVAVVPVDSVTDRRSTANAETVTEAFRTALHRAGFLTVTPGCAGDVIRRRQAGFWGGVGSETRAGLRELCDAAYVVTGSVEAYEVGGLLNEPEPLVAVALRMVDTGTGRILWMGGLDGGGWDHSGLLRTGRVYSRGVLVEKMTDKLTRRMRRELFPEGKKE